MVLVTGLVGMMSSAIAAGALVQLREFTATTRSARGDFTQTQIRPDGSAAPQATGRFMFSRPGRFRWEVRTPYEQLVVAASDQVQFYDKDLKQLTIRPMDEAFTATPAAILLGAQDLQRFFFLREVGQRDGVDWLEAIPKAQDAGFEWVRVGMRGAVPVAMEVRDAFGQVTHFDFQSLERNLALDAAAFKFTPPPGVDIIQ
jgi:outer membrane lipoprotein carrier protein